ncbi:class F sortase [Streptomyces glomeratus]|uniref:Class F sortase n=1 Tax=Streptomyces glomeratus TaxID=284452 RepID=A0ABP6M0I5_9ACTN|nr:class F sortase [Streptomyces glomeratus]
MTPSPPAPTAQSSTATTRTVSRALLLPAAAVALGGLLIHHSITPPADPKPPTPSAAAINPAAGPPPAALPPALPPTQPAPRTTAPSVLETLRRSAPKRIIIPQIGVDAPFTKLSLDASGHLNPPPVTNRNLVGWYKNGVAPGERGTALVVGHVDTKTGAAVFVFLRLLKPGNSVTITRADGSTARFQVDSVETFSKAHFPDKRVYANAPTPQLRLITCGGDYDHAAHEYLSNTVVFAHLVTLTPPRHTTAPATPAPPATPTTPSAPVAPALPAAPTLPTVPLAPSVLAALGAPIAPAARPTSRPRPSLPAVVPQHHSGDPASGPVRAAHPAPRH